jgi:hypothetical protein
MNDERRPPGRPRHQHDHQDLDRSGSGGGLEQIGDSQAFGDLLLELAEQAPKPYSDVFYRLGQVRHA